MKLIYDNILLSISKQEKLLAVLIDPDKIAVKEIKDFIEKVNSSVATHIFVGGSTVAERLTEKIVVEIKVHTNLPVVIFPGDITQITDHVNDNWYKFALDDEYDELKVQWRTLKNSLGT